MPREATQPTGYTVQEEVLTVRNHMDPDKHWVGETLAVPTQTEIAATIGTTSGAGDSPFVARADHTHKIDVNLLPKYSNIFPGATDDATTSTSFATWLQTGTFTIPWWAKQMIIQTFITGVFAITASAGYYLDAIISGQTYTTDSGTIAFVNINERQAVAFSKRITATIPTGTQNIQIGARRYSGTGQMRADTLTQVTLNYWFLP